MAILVTPSSLAFETAADSPRALKLPVGLRPSSLIQMRFEPAWRCRASAGSGRRGAGGGASVLPPTPLPSAARRRGIAATQALVRGGRVAGVFWGKVGVRAKGSGGE